MRRLTLSRTHNVAKKLLVHAFIHEKVEENIEWHNLVIEEDVCNVCKSRFRGMRCARKLRIAVGNKEGIMLALRSLRKRSKDVHGNEVERSRVGKVLYLLLVVDYKDMPRTAFLFGDWAFKVCGHLGQRNLHQSL